MGCWFLDGYGWAEVVPEGYGIAYMCKRESLDFNVVCLVGSVNDSPSFARYLDEACDEV